jgi:hypothetical protein
MVSTYTHTWAAHDGAMQEHAIKRQQEGCAQALYGSSTTLNPTLRGSQKQLLSRTFLLTRAWHTKNDKGASATYSCASLV